MSMNKISPVSRPVEHPSNPCISNKQLIGHKQNQGGTSTDHAEFDKDWEFPCLHQACECDHKGDVHQIEPVGRVRNIANDSTFCRAPSSEHSNEPKTHQPCKKYLWNCSDDWVGHGSEGGKKTETCSKKMPGPPTTKPVSFFTRDEY